MASVDPIFAQWLQGAGDKLVSTDAAAAARWGTTAVTVERETPIATRAAAQDEATRQLAFLARGPFAIDEHQLLGTDWAGALGRVVTLTGPDLGYDAGVDVLVIGVEGDRGKGTSTVTVARPLRPA